MKQNALQAIAEQLPTCHDDLRTDLELSFLRTALPFKIIFFVLVDGRYMIAGSLVRSFG